MSKNSPWKKIQTLERFAYRNVFATHPVYTYPVCNRENRFHGISIGSRGKWTSIAGVLRTYEAEKTRSLSSIQPVIQFFISVGGFGTVVLVWEVHARHRFAHSERGMGEGGPRRDRGINRAFTRYPVNLIKAIARPSSLPGSNDLRCCDHRFRASAARYCGQIDATVRFVVRRRVRCALKTGRKKNRLRLIGQPLDRRTERVRSLVLRKIPG